MISKFDLSTKGHSLPLFSQLSVCFNQSHAILTPQLQESATSFTAVKSLSQQAESSVLFLKGEAIDFILKPQALVLLCENLSQSPVSVYLCSTAFETLTGLEAEWQQNLEAYSQIQSCQVAGLGTWIECNLQGLALDFSTFALLPDFVVITAKPDSSAFMQQLDLALAAATFDLEPRILLLGDARFCLTKQYEEAPFRKKLASAKVYGVKECLAEQAAEDYLLEVMAQSSITSIPHCMTVNKNTPSVVRNLMGHASNVGVISSGVDPDVQVSTRFMVV